MTATYNMRDARAQLSRLVERAAEGEEIVIARSGRPVARLVALEKPRKKREFGFLKGEIWVSDDFDDPLPPEIQRYFDGEGD
jgi:prevent-host-death family protein